MGKVLRGMQPGEHREEVAIPGRGIGDARVTEQQGEATAKRCPEHHDREDYRDAATVHPLDEHGDDRRRRVWQWLSGWRDKLAPGHHSDDGKIHREVDDRDAEQTDHDGTWNDFARLADFVTDETHVVVAQVVIDAEARGGAQAQKIAER